ncbi:MAG: hypothetical protein K6G42_00270 [Lachnospiraceae bacterium]|nr:hypothetical protein [Lachnospiraceae bacterium]
MAKQVIESGDILHATNERVKELEIVIKGSFVATSGNVSIKLPYGSIIGLFESPGEKYRFDYEASEDSMVASYSYHSEENLRALLKANPQITPLITTAVVPLVQTLFEKTAQLIEACRDLADMLGIEDKTRIDLQIWRSEYFRSISRMLPSKDIAFCSGTILYAYEYMQRLALALEQLIDKKSDYQMKLSLKEEEEAQADTLDEGAAGDEDPAEEEAGSEEDGEDNPKAASKSAKTEMSDALKMILDYSETNEGDKETFTELIEAYTALKDKSSTEDDVRRMRKRISEMFYDIYERAFLRSVVDRDIPLVLKMFFYYGFIDERLAGSKNTQALVELMRSYKPDPNGNVVSIYEWLKLIYDGKVEPSKNEFDMEYPKYLKQRYDDGEIKLEEMKRLEHDRKGKVSFEIHNFMRLGSRITYGRVTTFVPVFTEESTVRPPQMCVTRHEAVHETLDKIRETDFSCFTRQIVYSNVDIGITREFLDIEILPYVILMPNGGSRSALWQEISGPYRNTPGRMMMPAFLDKDVEPYVMRLAGEFRWEMCRREQGVHWNDVTTPSLTSLFCDYLQFYRKNHDLSPDIREKIKAQLQSARNSSKAVFVSDYINYIAYESHGSLRLNKASREIIFRFCPFTSEIRQKLATSSPAYQKLLERYDIKLSQKKRLMEIVYTKVEKAGASIPEEIKAQRAFLDK